MTAFPYHERSAEQRDSWPVPRFDLVQYCSDVYGTVATQSLWKRLDYGASFEDVRKKAAANTERYLEYRFAPEWVPSTETILESIKLVPARLQKDDDKWSTRTDRVYCEFHSHGRQILVTHFGLNNSDSYTGISVALLPDEQVLYRKEEYERLNRRLQALLHLIVGHNGGCAPFETTIVPGGADQSCRLQGKNVASNGGSDSGAPPSNNLSAMAGKISVERLTVVFRTATYFRDPDTGDFLYPLESARFWPPNAMFERYVRLVTDERKKNSGK